LRCLFGHGACSARRRRSGKSQTVGLIPNIRRTEFVPSAQSSCPTCSPEIVPNVSLRPGESRL
jgi:hypothetical protein